MMLLGLGFPFSAMIISLLAWLLIGNQDDTNPDNWEWGWRLLYISSSLLEMVVLLLTYFFMPESPRFLLVAGPSRRDELVHLLRKHTPSATLSPLLLGEGGKGGDTQTPLLSTTCVDGEHGKKSGDANQVVVRLGEEGVAMDDSSRSQSVLTVMKQVMGWGANERASDGSSTNGLRLGLTTPLLWLIWFGTSFGAQGFNMYLPSLLDRKGVTQASHLYRDLMVYNAAGIPGRMIQRRRGLSRIECRTPHE
jgi:MFS family permease